MLWSILTLISLCIDRITIAMQAQIPQRKVLRTICPDAKGLIAKITNICYKHELNIVQNNEFVDHRTGRFFMRTELEGIDRKSTQLNTSHTSE